MGLTLVKHIMISLKTFILEFLNTTKHFCQIFQTKGKRTSLNIIPFLKSYPCVKPFIVNDENDTENQE